MKVIIYKPKAAVEIKQTPPSLPSLPGGGDEPCFVIVNTLFPLHGPPGPVHVQVEVPEPDVAEERVKMIFTIVIPSSSGYVPERV